MAPSSRLSAGTWQFRSVEKIPSVKGKTRIDDAWRGAGFTSFGSFLGDTEVVYVSKPNDDHLAYWKSNFPEVYRWYIDQQHIAIEAYSAIGNIIFVRSAPPLKGAER